LARYVALLRAVNVGGTVLKMEALRALLSSLGFDDVRSYIQSGNLVFGWTATSPAKLEEELAARTERSLGVRTEYFVRTANEWHDIIDRNPFPSEAGTEPARLTVTLLKSSPPPVAWETLRSAVKGREVARAGARHAYIVYPDGIGQSKLTPSVIEKALGTRGTTRNWNTVTKLAALLDEA
jgi:uncharacterized protein (DUF1697 family)